MPRYAFKYLILVAVTILLQVSCIDENNDNCVQCSVVTSPKDSIGRILPDSVKGNMQAYLFINGKFDRIVTSDADGSYKISYDSGAGSATLVTIGSSSKDSAIVYTPKYGDDISKMSYSVLKDKTDGGYTLPSSLYYGRYDCTMTRGGTTVDTTIVLSNQPAILRVVIKQLKESFGNYDDYKVVLSGFRSNLTFSGEVTGDSIIYTPPAHFNDNNEFVTAPVRTFPTKKGEYVTVSIYRGDKLIQTLDRDINGKKLSVGAGSDVVLVLDCFRNDMTMTVMPWKDYIQDVVIP
ncbi:FimB/Mfa2 family fimbrial subunit [Xylanibacter oryzae]|uniref:FimB/Mfa2 family fimbrial subunit n=1 Tax=Xylanibacter oryzae TaxID=185293 RepID=UPI0004B227C0|nr:FimB/Mfa2 family fimbrial subunit [Xylanibacter oryzae]